MQSERSDGVAHQIKYPGIVQPCRALPVHLCHDVADTNIPAQFCGAELPSICHGKCVHVNPASWSWRIRKHHAESLLLENNVETCRRCSRRDHLLESLHVHAVRRLKVLLVIAQARVDLLHTAARDPEVCFAVMLMAERPISAV